MAFLSRRWAAPLLAFPALLVPAIEIPMVLWARASFLARHPDEYDEPPTISRAIADPLVGNTFADLSLLITMLVLGVMLVLVWAYAQAIWRLRLGRGERAVMFTLLALVFGFQVIALSGMVVLTQYTFATNDNLHMMGSYYFFIFQGLAVLMAATLCRSLLARKRTIGISDAEWQFPPRMHRFRFAFGLLTAALAAGYGVVFAIKDLALPISDYAVHIIYTQGEILVVSCFVLFLGSYGVDIHHMVTHGKLPRRSEAGEATGAATASALPQLVKEK